MRNEFRFFESFSEAISLLPTDELRGQLFNAIIQYAFDNKLPENLQGIPKAMFGLIKTAIDLSAEVEEEE